MPEHNGNVPKSDTEIYFDTITLTTQKSEDMDMSEVYMLVDSRDPATYSNLGLPESSEVLNSSGKNTLKWTGKSIANGLTFKNAPSDLSPYTTVVFEMYGAVPSDVAPIRLVLVSENPDTNGSDYYSKTIQTSFTDWQTFTLPLAEFSKVRTPLGLDNITEFTMWNTYSGVSIPESTVIYIDKIYLASGELPGMSETEDYILEAQSDEDFEDMAGLVKQKNPNKSHPRLLFDKLELENIKNRIATDSFAKRAYASILKNADTALIGEPLPYGTPDGKRLERSDVEKLEPLAMAYMFTGENKYKDKLWQYLEAVCNFPDWNPSHFLDIGDYARHVSFAYDWLYDEWTEKERRIIRNGLMRNAFKPSMDLLRTKTGFAGQENNWNEVINAGLGLAALAMADEPGYEEICNEVLNRGVDTLPKGLGYFAPDGGCSEGPGYWQYAMQCFFQFNKSQFTAMGTDFGLTELEGINKTGFYVPSVTGPTGRKFNFGDTADSNSWMTDPCLFWLAERFNNPELASYVVNNRTVHTAMDLAFYRGADESIVFADTMPNDSRFKGNQETIAFRSTWGDVNALFVAFKAGWNGTGHNDLDLGTFVLDANGQRWFSELGQEYYEAPGMWESGRWDYYRKNTEGQNTIVINPDDSPGQGVTARATVEKYQTSASASYAIIDLSEAYADDANEVKRGIGLINNRSSVIIQDEIKTKGAAEVYTFYHTSADIDISDDGKTAILSLEGAKLKCQLLSPADGKFTKMDAKPLPTSADPGYTQLSNDGITKLAVHLENAKNPTISVLCTPIMDGSPETITPSSIPFDRWDEYVSSAKTIESIMVDGIKLYGFKPTNTSYTISTGVVGKVTAAAGDDIMIEVIDATGINTAAFVVATSKSTGLQTVYTINFIETIPGNALLSRRAYDILSSEASDVPEAGNTPECTYDGNYATRWAAEGEQWITWDLGDVKELNSVMLSFMNGNARKSIFDILISEDNKNWTKVFSGMSSGKTNDLEEYSIGQQKARYIRCEGKGNTSNKWNSITEIKVPQSGIVFEDTINHWAKNSIMEMNSYGYVNGVSDTLFLPDNLISRAEFIAMVTRVCGFETEEYKKQYDDVNSADWYAQAISMAHTNNIIPDEMIKNNCIMPNEYISREEMSAIIVMAYESKKGTVNGEFDVGNMKDIESASEYAGEYIKKGLSLRFITGKGNGMFDPTAKATRAEAVVIMKRLLTQI